MAYLNPTGPIGPRGPHGPPGPPGIPLQGMVEEILEMTEEMQQYPLLDFDSQGNTFRRNDLKFLVLTAYLQYDPVAKWIEDNLKSEDYFFWNYTDIGICFVKEEDAMMFYLRFA